MQAFSAFDRDDLPRPVVLSTVPLPLHPSKDAQNSGAGPSSSDKKQRYRHVLSPRAINPYKDLVALISQDVDATTASASGADGSSADPYAGLPPPPPGMGAAAAAALMRMRMIARAKALAQQKAAGGAAASEASSSTSKTGPRLNKSATIRLSLWRMSSIAGQLGQRVWDVAVKPPELFDDLPDANAVESEDVAVDALTWSPDGSVLALAVRVVRRQNGVIGRQHRFVGSYALQDGKCIQTTLLPDHSAKHAPSDTHTFKDMQWIVLDDLYSLKAFGSAAHIMSMMSPLPPTIASKVSDKEQKARNRQRMLQRMRDPRQAQVAEAKTAEELMASDARGKGKALLLYPHALRSPSEGDRLGSDEDEKRAPVTLLQVSDGRSIHSLLDASIYLGSATPSTCTGTSPTADVAGFTLYLDEHVTKTLVATHRQGSLKADLAFLPSTIDIFDDSTQALILLRDLSSSSHSLLTYLHDCGAAIKNAYTNFHADNVVVWNKRAISIGKKYGTTFTRDFIVLLTTGVASEAMVAALMGNGAPTEKEVKALQSGTTIQLEKMESLVVAFRRAAQQLILVYEELLGCAKWPERFAAFFAAGDMVQECDRALSKLGSIIALCSRLVWLLAKEKYAYNDFYTWWSFERVKQEAVRDEKAAPELPSDCIYNIITLSAFAQRGFDSPEIEALIDVKIEDRARGIEIEDDDEDEDSNDVARKAITKHRAQVVSRWSSQAAKTSESKKADSNANAARKAWYMDDILTQSFATTKAKLSEPPSAPPHEGRVRHVPTIKDVSQVAQSTDMFEGLLQGFAKRQESAQRTRDGSLPALVHEILAIMSQSLYTAFACWADARAADNGENILPPMHLVSPLTNLGETDSKAASNVPKRGREVRMHYSRQARTCLALAACSDADESKSGICSSVQVSKISLPPKPDSSAIAAASITLRDADCSSLRVRDAQWYSSKELVLLSESHASANEETETEAKTQSRTALMSFRLEDLHFDEPESLNTDAANNDASVTPTRFMAIEPLDVGGRATMLACNANKEVLATLDEGIFAHTGQDTDDDEEDACEVVYWDMVAQNGRDVTVWDDEEEESEEYQIEAPSQGLRDEDEDMQ